VEVAELLPEVVAWNREFLMNVNGKLLRDPRVKVLVDDVYKVIRKGGDGHYDAILLDVDNGPTSFVQPKNARLYDRNGFNLIRSSLTPNGKVAFWSACPEPDFVKSLTRAGFKVEAVPAKANDHSKRFAHMIYLARRAEAEAGA
jgi:spermidine synthase